MQQELRTLTPELLRHLSAQEETHPDYVPEVEPLATWWVQETPGTTYWRAQVPAKHLPGQALHLRWTDLTTDDEGVVYTPRHKGAAIWQFAANASRGLIMAHMQEQGHKVMIEVDDNYLVPPPTVPGRMNDWKKRLDGRYDSHSFQAHRKLCRWVDGIIVSTDELANRYENATTAPIYVCPNSVDLDDWPDPLPQLDGALAIGYAGSASHLYDVHLIDRAMDWACRQKGVSVVKLGISTAVWRYPHYELPWTDDLHQYRKNLRVLNVGLCPLRRSDWSDGKSDIKAMEYLLAGAVPIVQNSPPYADWIDLVPACDTEKDWLKTIQWACKAPREELYEVWKRAYDYLLKNKLIEQHIEKWRLACMNQ